jgi:formylglycine-generating enzyme required for sulfatase activity
VFARLCFASLVLGAGLSARSNAAPRAKIVPDRVRIPAGAFVRGSNVGEEDERPERKESLPSYRMDRTEVTVAMYAVCVGAKRCKAPVGVELGDAVIAKRPITGVNWDDARNFCKFAGGRLPTEAEWEKAARGDAGRVFPWGAEADCKLGNWGCFDNEGPCAGFAPGHPVDVGGYPAGASPYGVLDLAGNVWEWTADAYSEDEQRRVVKGGSCCSYFVPPRAANRNAWAPDYRDSDLGFRCVSR